MLPINKVAQKYNISIRTLRYYEEIDLIHSNRNEANIQTYDDLSLERLSLVILFKFLGFKLAEIKMIMSFPSNEELKPFLTSKLNNIEDAINELIHRKQLLRSLLKTYGSNDISKQNIQEFIKEQIFFKKSDERLMQMLTNTNNIVLEFGKNLIPCAMSEDALALIPSIKKLRHELESNFLIKMDMIRVRDNLEDLESNEYRILQNNVTVLKKEVFSDDIYVQTDHIISNLKALII